MRRLLLALIVLLAAPALADESLHSEPWFLESFLDLRQDGAEAEAEGKLLAVVVEQRGCIYCQKMHEVHLADPAIAGYIRRNFAVLQLDMHGAREVTDLDGAVLSEKALVRKWQIRLTPTVVFLRQGRELGRMPGLLEPGLFLGMFQWAKEGRPGSTFSQYLEERKGRK
jgi:thioredoxin-related protein